MQTRAASVSFIFATIFLDSLGVGLLIPVFPDIIRRFNSDPTFVNHYYGYFISIYSLMQFLVSPILGSLSDKFGRRPILLSSLFGAGIDYVLMAFAPTLPLLFLGRVISGLSGASMTVASSYMADISTDKNRSTNFGMIGAAFGLGFIVGPALGGSLGHWGSKAPFLAAAFLNLLNALFGLLILPESLPKDSRREIERKNLNPLRSLSKTFNNKNIRRLAIIYLLIYLSGQVHPSVWTLYTQYKFHWTALDVGLSLSFVGIVIALSQGGLTRILIPKIGEKKSLNFGLYFYILAFALFAVATQGWMMYGIMFLFSFSGVASPALQSLISKEVPKNEQGELQGSLISIASLTAILGPLLYTGLFSTFTSHEFSFLFPGAPYLCASFITVLALILSFTQRP